MFKGPEGFPFAMPPFQQWSQVATQQLQTLLTSQAGGGEGAEAAPRWPEAEALAALQKDHLERHARLWQSMLAASAGKPEAEPYRVEAEPGDRRFAAPEWAESPLFDYLRQAYLLNARFVRELVELVPTDDEKAKNKLRFMARQYADALAPSNFAATNPEFVKQALATKGASITTGIRNLIGDLEKGRISMTDESVFEVGKNIATSEGSVVFENELIQLIQYKPLTAKVGKRPLLIVPPCINKYYILDLQPDNSLVRFAVEQGHTVFLVSWRNPKADLGHFSWNDYLEKGPIAAIEAVRGIAKVREFNVLGFCVGGTLLTSALAVLKARGDSPATSLTLLTTFLDFSDTGDLAHFVADRLITTWEATIGRGGLLSARELSTTFSALRPNDLIWNYVANNYLKGQKPAAFDLLYWNSDSTNLPGPMACWYLRNMYRDNALRVPGKLDMCGVKVDLGKLDMPVYILATREDHIVPWQSSFQSTRLLSGPKRFVLGASGHIAGVVNPASKNKRSFWKSDDLSADALGWLAGATEHKGSWWLDWADWLADFKDGEKAAPKKAGGNGYAEIEPAPGRYVKEKA